MDKDKTQIDHNLSVRQELAQEVIDELAERLDVSADACRKRISAVAALLDAAEQLLDFEKAGCKGAAQAYEGVLTCYERLLNEFGDGPFIVERAAVHHKLGCLYRRDEAYGLAFVHFGRAARIRSQLIDQYPALRADYVDSLLEEIELYTWSNVGSYSVIWDNDDHRECLRLTEEAVRACEHPDGWDDHVRWLMSYLKANAYLIKQLVKADEPDTARDALEAAEARLAQTEPDPSAITSLRFEFARRLQYSDYFAWSINEYKAVDRLIDECDERRFPHGSNRARIKNNIACIRAEQDNIPEAIRLLNEALAMESPVELRMVRRIKDNLEAIDLEMIPTAHPCLFYPDPTERQHPSASTG